MPNSRKDVQPKGVEPLFDTDKINKQLKHWREQLFDLSRSNPLLNIGKSRAARLSISSPDAALLFTRLHDEEAKLKLPHVKRVPKKKGQSDDAVDVEEEVYEYKIQEGDIVFAEMPAVEIRRRLHRIYDNARTTIEERGLLTLYVTIGAVHWSDDYFGDSVSPLLLVPCQFIYKGPNAPLVLQMADDDPQLNPSIEYYFREKHRLHLPEFNVEEGIQKYFKQTLELLKEQGWSITEEVWLGTFNFEKMVLLKDLEALRDKALNNSIVAALSRASDEVFKNEALGDDLDELPIPEKIPIPAGIADSTQLKAIAYAAFGQNLVIHGPPGTGKSQTITNIIADALGKHKKILFVSAKIAALNVVHKRLKDIGLGDFCLEAHSTKAGKQKIADELKRTLESVYSHEFESIDADLELLNETRRQLNEYTRIMHTRVEPVGKTPYEAIGRFLKLDPRKLPRFEMPWKDIGKVSNKQLQQALDALANLASSAELYDDRNLHPLRGFSSSQLSLVEAEKLKSSLSQLLETCSSFGTRLKSLRGFIKNAEKLTWSQLSIVGPVLGELSKLDRLPDDWLVAEQENLKERSKLLKAAAVQLDELAKKRSDFAKISKVTPNQLAAKLGELGNFKKPLKRLWPKYWRWLSGVRGDLSIRVRFKDLEAIQDLANKILVFEEWLKTRRASLVALVGEVSVSDINEILREENRTIVALELREALTWLQKVPTRPAITVLQDVGAAAASLDSDVSEQSKTINSVIAEIQEKWPDGFCDGVHIAEAPLDVVTGRLTEVLNGFDGRQPWIQLQRSIARCTEAGLQPALFALAKESASTYPETFERRFLELWIDHVTGKSVVLAEFSAEHQHELVTKLRLIDERIRDLNLKKIIAGASEPIRRIQNAQTDPGSSGEVGTLRYEVQKKKRLKPLRKLFAEIPKVLQAIKPCMLMSPISVSTYLHPERFQFDVIIFDEASQLPPAEAIPSILRGSQVIVAGDANQLPPTSFFETSIMDDDDDADGEDGRIDSLESLLDNCVAVVPAFQQAALKWHYRSRDERLISFSNYYFYNNGLATFPSDRTDNIGRGVRLEYLSDGVWDRGKSRTNRKEARRVAKLVIAHCEICPEKSLGVVALNTAQKEAIEDAIDDELLHRSDLTHFFESEKSEPFFVKSLENVQGDERDVMIISVGYAKDPSGALSYNFGPINRPTGWRRLNVLVTRAKWQLILVTSLRSGDLNAVNPESLGPVHLKNFIEYAERGGKLPIESSRPNVEAETNDFEDAVRDVIRSHGYTVDEQVGASHYRIDLAIRDPKDEARYLLGVECDGATYHSSRSARDRDLLREGVLHDMGWRLYRVWSTDWFWNRDQAVLDLLAAIKRADKSEPRADMPKAALASTLIAKKPLNEVITEKRLFSAGVQYAEYKGQHERDAVMDSANIYDLEAIIASIVEMEGPIHESLLTERILEVCGVARQGTNVKNNVSRAVSRASRAGKIVVSNQFLYWQFVGAGVFRTPSPKTRRPLKLIASEEIENAVLFLVEDQFGMMKEQMPQHIARLFDVQRLSPEDSDRLRDVIDDLVDSGRLVVNGSHVTLAG